MPDVTALGRAAACAFAAAALLGVAGLRSAPRERSLAGLVPVAGWVWGTVAGLVMLRALPHAPPASALDRLLLILLPVTLAIEIEVAGGWLDGWLLVAERGMVALLAVPVLLLGSVWMAGPAALSLGAILAAALFLWAAWEGVEAQVAATADRLVPAVIAAALLTAGAAIGAGGWWKGATVAVTLAAGLAGTLVADLVSGEGRRRRTAAGLAAVTGIGIVALFGCVVAGTFFGRLRAGAAVLVVAAPLLAALPAGIAWFLPESAGERLLRSITYRLALAAVPLVAVLAAARADLEALRGGLERPVGQAAASGAVNARQCHPSDAVAVVGASPSPR